MNFSKFDFKIKSQYQSFYKHLPPYSDFSFNNLLVWLDFNDDLSYCLLEGNYVFRFSNPFEDNQETYTVIGSNASEDVLDKLFAHIETTTDSPKLEMVPECFVDSMGTTERDKYTIREEPDNMDYIFDIAQTHRAKGKPYAKIREAINYFVKHYGDNILLQPIDLHDDKGRALIINSLHQWRSVYSMTENDRMRSEGIAIDRYLRFAPQLDVNCIGLYVDGQLQAFGIFHLPPQGDYAIFNHLKCNYDYKNIFDLSFYSAIGMMNDLGATLVNAEQDLGIEGIRKHKQALNPVKFLKRYTISRPS